MSKMKNSFLSLAVMAIVGIIVLWIINVLFFQTGIGVNINFSGNHGGGYYMSAGLGYGATISTLLLLLIKVLFVLFIVGLVVGIAIAVKNYVFTEEDFKKIKGAFTSKTRVSKGTCSTCGKTIETQWRACPHCGTLKEEKTLETVVD